MKRRELEMRDAVSKASCRREIAFTYKQIECLPTLVLTTS